MSSFNYVPNVQSHTNLNRNSYITSSTWTTDHKVTKSIFILWNGKNIGHDLQSASYTILHKRTNSFLQFVDVGNTLRVQVLMYLSKAITSTSRIILQPSVQKDRTPLGKWCSLLCGWVVLCSPRILAIGFDSQPWKTNEQGSSLSSRKHPGE